MEVPAGKDRGAAEWLALLFFTSGVFLRFFGLGRRQLWLDEIIQLQRFSSGGWIDNILNLRLEIAAAPLDYVLQHAVVSALGRGEWAARLHAALFGCLAIWIFYLFCRRLLPQPAALLALLLLAVSPLHVWYSQEGRGYSLFFLLTIGAYFALWEALHEGGFGRWALYGATLTLCLYTNYLALAGLLAQAVFVGLHAASGARERPVRGRLRSFVASAGLALLAFSPWIVHTFAAARAAVPNVFLEWDLWIRVLKEISGGGYPLSALLIGFFAAAALGLWRSGRRTLLWLLTSWLLVPVAVALLLVWWRGYFFAIRQALVCLPPLLAGAALGMAGGAGGGRRIPGRPALAAAGLAVAISLGAIGLHFGEEEADWRSLNQFLSGPAADLPVVAPNIDFALSYFHPDLPARSPALQPEGIAASLCRRPGSRVVLAESRYMDAAQAEAANRLKSMVEVVGSETFHGFQAHILACRENR